MISFIVRRILQAIPTLWGISLIAFVLLKTAPGDPARILAGKNATPAFLAAKRHELYLDRSYPEQYWHFLQGFYPPWNMDFGDSWAVERFTPVTTVIWEKFPRTVALAIGAIVIEVVFGIALGVFSALMHRRKIDTVVTVVNLGVYSLPVFVVGSVLLFTFALPHPSIFGLGVGWDFTGWFNANTQNPPSFLGSFEPTFWIKNLLWPSVTLALVSVASTALVMRTSLLEVVRADYMKTARAKGLPPSKVIGKHALKNALLPVITLVGLDFAIILGGAVITESIWNWDGIGRLVISAINARDLPVVMVLTMLLAAIFVVVNTIVDILYAVVNPKIRLEDVE
jgi:ABC-type dipeptide/oligopeptide/nickel transport system permease component